MATATALEAALVAGAARTSRAGSLAALLADPRKTLAAAVVLLSAAVGLDALGDPDVWWHLRLGDWIVANHRVPGGELFSYTAAGHPLLAHEWLSDTVF